VVGGVEQLARQTVNHGGLITLAGSGDQPADRQRLTALRTNVDRNLIRGTTDAARTHFHVRRDIVERLMEDGDRLLLRLALNLVQGAVDDGLGDRLLAVKHDGVHELRDDEITELRIRVDLTLFCTVATGHVLCLSRSSARLKTEAPKPRNPFFGRFAPYLERRCLRFFTPCVSSTPRMMW